jgi:uncharacterized repeat protein (TIGR01451 family)
MRERAIALAVIALALGFTAVGANDAGAATQRTWLGGSGPDWGTAANWSPAGAPTDGDALVFPATAATLASNNDIASLHLAGLQVAANHAISGLPLTLDSVFTVTSGSPRVDMAITLGTALTIDVARYATLTLGGTPGSIDLGGHALTVQGAGEVDVLGDVSGFAPVTIAEGAAVVFESPTSYIGATTVAGGALGLLSGTITAPGVTTVAAGGVIGGTGSVGKLEIEDGQLSPGLVGSPASLGALNLSMTAASTARFRLAPNAADGYDQVLLNGPLALGSARLELRWDVEPVIGQRYTIIAGATALSGTFARLPEGAAFVSGGRRFSITYTGGAGHDVVVTRLPAADADLAIAVAAPASVRPGGEATFTLTASNAGPADAPLPVVSLDLAPGFRFVLVSAPAGYACDTPGGGAAGQVTCRGGSLAAGSSAVITVVATAVADAGPRATVQAAVSSAANELASSDNSTSASVTIAADARPYRAYAPGVAAD